MQIIICKKCRGIGNIPITVGDMKTDETCWKCKGTGKQTEYSFKMTIPYGKNAEKIEKTILLLIKEAENG